MRKWANIGDLTLIKLDNKLYCPDWDLYFDNKALFLVALSQYTK